MGSGLGSKDIVGLIYVTGSAKRGLIAHLETRNLTCEFGKTLKLGPIILLM